MEHKEAIELKAAERYVMRELPVELRDAYEEHFFDCAECAADIKAATSFAETSREIFADEGQRGAVDVNKEYGSVWSRWLRPALALSAVAALTLVLALGYHTRFSAPKNNEIAAVAGQFAQADGVRASARVLGDERRGAGDVAVVKVVRPADGFTLNFDFLPSQEFDSYRGELQDVAGHTVLPVTLSGDMVKREVNVAVPGGLVHAGKYTLAFYGVSAAPNAAAAEQRVETFTFNVEFTQ
jgi:hypothetical protein